jgi:hypothetical protein
VLYICQGKSTAVGTLRVLTAVVLRSHENSSSSGLERAWSDGQLNGQKTS